MGDQSASVYFAGHQGMAGSALVRRLLAQGYAHIVTRTRAKKKGDRIAEAHAIKRRAVAHGHFLNTRQLHATTLAEEPIA